MIHLDYETTSVCDITLGSYRYAEDPSTRILMFAVADENSEPVLWDFTDPECDESMLADSILRRATANGDLVYAHNAAFELAVSHYRLQPDLGIAPPDIHAWRCTLAMCRRAAAPESLAEAARFFGLGQAKDAIGKALIGIFSDQTKVVTLEPPTGMKDPDTVKQMANGRFTVGRKPNNRKSASPILDSPILWDWQVKVAGDFMTVRDAWEKFKEYCRQDVRVERVLHERLKHFELRGDVLESFQFDLRMNFRGVPVNRSALTNAITIVESLKETLTAKFQKACGLEPGQREAVLQWLQARGYPADNLQAGTVSDILDSPPAAMTPLAIETLRMRSLISFAALAKIPTMLNAACSDGRVRGTVQWHAARTGRGGGRIIQPQNFKKSTIDDSEVCYRAICEGWEPVWFEELWPSPLEAIASSIRHFIQPHKGHLLDGDYSSVEAMITCWIVGDKKKLQAILDGVDLYKRMATLVFGVKYEEVTKLQRTISKPIELSCGFGVAAKTLQESLSKIFKVERTRAECKEYVRLYRDNHPETVNAWREIEEGAKSAILNPGKRFTACNEKLEFTCGKTAGTVYLAMRLPSGRRLYYPQPKVSRVFKRYEEEDMVEEPWKREEGGYWIDEISFYGKHQKTGHWGRVHTWSSRLFENAVQAIGADLLNRGCIEAERRGYPIMMIVHDQALCESSMSSGGLEGFLKALCTKDEWASDFPLSASGAEHPFYLKD